MALCELTNNFNFQVQVNWLHLLKSFTFRAFYSFVIVCILVLFVFFSSPKIKKQHTKFEAARSIITWGCNKI
ncbi:MAG: hypothetical protein MI922_08040, partial [Bacteroidales bacterium]|nr:hypothetical protein [Bacteroidales bacterium]